MTLKRPIDSFHNAARIGCSRRAVIGFAKQPVLPINDKRMNSSTGYNILCCAFNKTPIYSSRNRKTTLMAESSMEKMQLYPQERTTSVGKTYTLFVRYLQ